MTLHPIRLNFQIHMRKFFFFFYQCTVNELGEEVVGKSDFIDEGQTRGENRQFGGFFMNWSAQRGFKGPP